MKIVAIKDMSAGNSEVGEMWRETKIFDGNDPISKVVEWATENSPYRLRKHVQLTVPDETETP